MIRLIWNNDGVAFADRYIKEVVANVIYSKLDTYPVCQRAIVDAFRLAILEGRHSHEELEIQVGDIVYPFNQYGNIIHDGANPIPHHSDHLMEEILLAQVRKKRAERAARSVDPDV